MCAEVVMDGHINVRHKLYPSKPLKLPITHCGERYVTVEKPAGISCTSIVGQIRENLGKPSVMNLGTSHPDIVYGIDDAMSGILLLSKNSESAGVLRNMYGSNLMEFTFDIFCKKSSANKDTDIVCSLPIARHSTNGTMLISNRTGKKSCTTFRFIEDIGMCEHWRATCTYMRRDQILLHAHESGLSVLGDEIYGGTKIPMFFELKHNFKANRKSDGRPYFGVMANLSALKMGDGTIIHGELPKKMQTFLKFLANSWGSTKF